MATSVLTVTRSTQLSLMGNLASIIRGRRLLNDDFKNLDEFVWGAAHNCVDYAGVPQFVDCITMDGRSLLKMRSHMTSWQRRGFGTLGRYNLPWARLELDFMPISGIDGLLEFWLTEPDTGEYIGAGVYANNLGVDREIRTATSLESRDGLYFDGWDYGNWYRFTLDAGRRRTRIQFLNDNGRLIWQHVYNWPLRELGHRFRLNLIQRIGAAGLGTWKAETAIDRVALYGPSSQQGQVVLPKQPFEVKIDAA